MEELIKLLEDIKGALPLMIKLKAIDESAYKTLNDSISEAITLAKNNIVQANVSSQVCPFFMCSNTGGKCDKCGKEQWQH